jgi:hypothetical protein
MLAREYGGNRYITLLHDESEIEELRGSSTK